MTADRPQGLRGGADLEEIRGKPTHKIAWCPPRPSGPARRALGCTFLLDYFADYIAGYTLRHLHTRAGRKRCFPRLLAGTKSGGWANLLAEREGPARPLPPPY